MIGLARANAAAAGAANVEFLHGSIEDVPLPGSPRRCGDLQTASCPPSTSLRDYQAWLGRRLDALAGHPHLRLLRQFGQWAASPNRPAPRSGAPATGRTK